jgi:hypothetical protein
VAFTKLKPGFQAREQVFRNRTTQAWVRVGCGTWPGWVSSSDDIDQSLDKQAVQTKREVRTVCFSNVVHWANCVRLVVR